jgi:PncC family amidohydrolase
MAEQNVKVVEPNHRWEVKLEDFFTKVLSMLGKITDQQIADLLKQSHKTISAAESFTGGLISSHLSSTPGSSDFFIGGIVCYHSRIKVSQVGVPAAIISQYGAASRETAVAMAEGIKQRFGTDIGIAATGAAGPMPSPPAPVGRVYIALAGNKEAEWKELNLQGGRSEIREKAAQAALGMLWLYLGGSEVLS